MSDARGLLLPIVAFLGAVVSASGGPARSVTTASTVAHEGLAASSTIERLMPRTSRHSHTSPHSHLFIPPKFSDFSKLTQLERDFSPHRWCAELGNYEGAVPEFRQTPTGWECSASLTFGRGPEPNILFIQASGQDTDKVARFRAKLNILQQPYAKDLQTTISKLLAQLPLMLSDGAQDYLAKQILALRPMTSKLEGLHISLQPEEADKRRYNFSLVKRLALKDCEGVPPRPSLRLTLPHSASCLRLPSAGELPRRSY